MAKNKKSNGGKHISSESPAASERTDAPEVDGLGEAAPAAVEDLPPPPSPREQYELELESIEKQLEEIGDPFEKANELKVELDTARKERARAIEAHDAKVNRLSQEQRHEHWEIGVPNEGRKQKLENRRHELTNLIKKIDEEVTLG